MLKFICLFLLIFSKCSVDLQGYETHNEIEYTQSIKQFHESLKENKIAFSKQISEFETRYVPLPKEIWWIIAVYVGDGIHKIEKLSKEMKGYMECLKPQLAFPIIPTVRNILAFLDAIETCEKSYNVLKKWGVKNPYFPAYLTQVKKLIDSEIYVSESPVFNESDNKGIQRLSALRDIHYKDKSKKLIPLFFRMCSSFARDPLIGPIQAVGFFGLTALFLYDSFYLNRPEDWLNFNDTTFQYLRENRTALALLPRSVTANEYDLLRCLSVCSWRSTCYVMRTVLNESICVVGQEALKQIVISSLHIKSNFSFIGYIWIVYAMIMLIGWS